MSSPAVFVGTDVAKGTLELAVRPTGDRWTVANEPAAIHALVATLRSRAPALVVLEATGASSMPWWLHWRPSASPA